MITVSTSARRKKYHHGDLRDALLAAALEILEESGDATSLSLREVARRAGVSAMAPYRHFADKEALLAGVAAIGFGRFAAALGQADRNPDGREALVGQGVAYVAFALANPALFRLMFGAASPETYSAIAESGMAAYGTLSGRVAAITPSENARDWTLACWAIVHGLASLALDGRLASYDQPPTVLAERSLRLLALMGDDVKS